MTPYSPSLVKIPQGLEFLADFTQQGYSITGQRVSVSYPIRNGVRSKIPRFGLVVDWNGNPIVENTTMKEFAASFIDERMTTPVVVNPDGNVTVGNSRYVFTNSETLSKTTTERMSRYMTQLVAFGGETVGMTVQQAVAYFGADFTIHSLSYTTPSGQPSGLFALENADMAGIINGQTTYFGWVSAERLLRDCIASNTYTVNRRTGIANYIAGPYKWLKQTSTVADLPAKIVVDTFKRMPVTNSVIPFLVIEGGKVKNNTFVNIQPFAGGQIQNPSGNNFTPTYVLMLTNGGPDQTAGGYSLRAMAQSVVHLTSFDEFSLVALTDGSEGRIDVNTKTIFINPNKKAVVRLEVTQARIGDIMAKTWAVEGAINVQTGQWSRYFEQL
jgi:hypothetical protein